MKKYFKILSVVALAFVMFAANVAEAAQVDVLSYKIRFAKGKTTATETRSISPNKIHDYTFRARKGQRLSVKLTSVDDAATADIGSVENFDIAPIEDNTTEWSGRLRGSDTGEYLIRIETEKATRYTLEVTIK